MKEINTDPFPVKPKMISTTREEAFITDLSMSRSEKASSTLSSTVFISSTIPITDDPMKLVKMSLPKPKALSVTHNQTMKQRMSAGSSATESKPHIWTLITSSFPTANPDSEFWWRRTGIPFAILLENAGYSLESQYQHLLFYHDYVAPELGASSNVQGLPRSWRSFMTDNFTPIEMSWEWGCEGSNPTVRFSFEPIGPYAGTAADPLNQYAMNRVIHQYQHLLSGCTLTLFDHFSRELLSYSRSPTTIEKSTKSEGNKSRAFLAVELREDEMMVKAYFIPTFKAAELEKSTWAVISQAIQSLPGYSTSAYISLTSLETFLCTSSQGSSLKVEIFAIDCIKSSTSRLKIYMRSKNTSFNSIRNVMSLNGELKGPSIDRGFQELYDLWRLIFPEAQSISSAEDFQKIDHRTAGILYYFDVKVDQKFPGVKVYLPVRHYGDSDLSIVKGLSLYLKRRNQDGLIQNYLKVLKAISGSCSIEFHRGFQTYLGCSIVDGRLNLTSYLAPKVYEV